MADKSQDKPVMTFRVLRGAHVGLDKDGRERQWRARRGPHNPPRPDDDPIDWKGDVIETRQDLSKLNDPRVEMQKFARIDFANQQAPVAPPPKARVLDLSMMDAAALKAHAEAEEIPVGNAKSKDELLKAIRAAMQPAAV